MITSHWLLELILITPSKFTKIIFLDRVLDFLEYKFKQWFYVCISWYIWIGVKNTLCEDNDIKLLDGRKNLRETSTLWSWVITVLFNICHLMIICQLNMYFFHLNLNHFLVQQIHLFICSISSFF